MSDWELLVPGIGLTLIGMAGVGLSLAGIAKTFLEGMHAISALVMFIGMIFLAAGLLKGGLPTTNSAKAAAAIIIGIMIAFGAYAASISNVPSLPLFIGVVLIIIAPSIVIAYAISKNSKHTKAISILFMSASAVGMIAFLSFNAATQPIEAGELEQEEEEQMAMPEGPRVEIIIPQDAAIPGNIPYDPQEVEVTKGSVIVWTNKDSVEHTVTSGTGFQDPDYGKLFDSGLLKQDEQFFLDTSELEVGDYTYFCTLHPVMVGKFTIVEGQEQAIEQEQVEGIVVEIVSGANLPDNPEFYKPDVVEISVGDTVTWINNDSLAHTVTGASNVKEASTWGDTIIAGEKFDSGIMDANTSWSFTFNEKGEYNYVCILHPWMIGKVIVR